MYTPLATTPLRSGQTLHSGVVIAPDPSWAPRLLPFLAHKQPQWRSHINAALDRPLDALQTRFYVGTVGPTEDPTSPIVTCVMVAGAARPAARIGLLGYVFTAPTHRGQGAYSALMAQQMEHCRGHGTGAGDHQGFTILTLTTQRDSTAWRIYERFGFRPDHPTTSGRMRWLAHPHAEDEWFEPSPVTIHALAWDDWPALNLTAIRIPDPTENEDPPRSWALYLPTHGTAEGTFSDVLPEWAQLIGKRPRERATYAVTLRSRTGAVAGWVIAIPDPLSLGAARQVDLYVHPSFETIASDILVEALRAIPPETPLTAYVTRAGGYRARALARAGFRPAAALPRWLSQDGKTFDVHVFRKSK